MRSLVVIVALLVSMVLAKSSKWSPEDLTKKREQLPRETTNAESVPGERE